MKRKTLNKEIQYNGIGLHKGEEIKMKLIPGGTTAFKVAKRAFLFLLFKSRSSSGALSKWSSMARL